MIHIIVHIVILLFSYESLLFLFTLILLVGHAEGIHFAKLPFPVFVDCLNGPFRVATYCLMCLKNF